MHTRVENSNTLQVYDGDGDQLMARDRGDRIDRITLIPDALPGRVPDRTPRLRIMWGQHLLEDLLAGRYRSLLCAVNTRDNSHGIIAQLAALLPTSQWDEKSITGYAAHFAAGDRKIKVLKFDMDMVEVLAVLRPAEMPYLTLPHLASAMRIVADMTNSQPRRRPSASVSFLGAHANMLTDGKRGEPSFETVLRTMYDAGYTGDVFPPPVLWHVGEVAVFARYPFATSLDTMRAGGF
jgi:hypothetical protein